METGDLFGLAQDLARLLGSPVTIEDRDTIVIAYAGDHQDVDEARVETILNRQVPVRYRTAITEAGVFERLRTTDEVIVVDLPEVSMTSRAVVALRDGDELLGSIWAALGAPPTDAQAAALRAAAPVVARHVARARQSADRAARERDALLARLLSGGEESVAAADEVGLDERLAVVALRGTDSTATGLAGALNLHLSAVAPRSVCAAQGDSLYAVLDATAARRIMADFLTRLHTDDLVVAGIGEATTAADLPASRAVADDVARALVRRGTPDAVAGLADVFSDVLVDRVRGFLTTHGATSPLAALERHDTGHDTGLVDAVEAYLGASGDVAAAAARLHVHPNTVRNRLRRARTACGVDVDDADPRLALMVHLAARRPG
jgi:DNA-binding PucR family transcriptional regulator